jgi:lipopolysaccharide/colanic/teichoic acid biosynthesis glycosyltransferase
MSFLLAGYLRQGSFDMAPGMQTAHLLVPLFLVLFIVIASAYRMDQGVWRFATQSDLRTIAKVAAISIGVFYFGLFLVHRLEDVPRSLPLIQWLLLLFLLGGTRLAYSAWLTPRYTPRSSGPSVMREPLLFVGAGQTTAILIDLLRSSPEVAIVGIIDDRAYYRNRAISGVPVLGSIAELERVIAQLAMHGMRPRRIVLAQGADEIRPDSLQVLYTAAERQDMLVQDALELLRKGGICGPPSAPYQNLTHTQPAPVRSFAWRFKRFVDAIVAASLLVITAPAMLGIAVAVRLLIGAPVIFHQVRPGRNLRAFTLYKFRTLADGYLPDGDILDDAARQTGFGRLLRRTRLDELPQLWNVLVGDMSLIGPRPLLPRDLPEFGKAVHERFRVRPGITGWAQVNGGHQLTTEEKMALDLWYIRTYRPSLDVLICLKTICMMAFGEEVNRQAIAEAARAMDACSSVQGTSG